MNNTATDPLTPPSTPLPAVTVPYSHTIKATRPPRPPVPPALLAQSRVLIALAVLFALMALALLILTRRSPHLDAEHPAPAELDDSTSQLRRRRLAIGRYSCYTAAALLTVVTATLLYCATLLLNT